VASVSPCVAAPAAADISARAATADAAGVVDPYQPMVAVESGVQLFQHEHLSHVSFNIFSKLPVLPLTRMGDLHRTVNQRIVLLAGAHTRPLSSST